MAQIISVVSQKGGVGKSTFVRLMAREAAINGLKVKIADLDTQQSTCTSWAARRIKNGFLPEIEVQPSGDLRRVRAEAERFDVYIFDGAPQASRQTIAIAEMSDLIVIPSADGIEDREPAVKLANDLYSKGISPDKIAFALCLVGSSQPQIDQATRYFGKTQYQLLNGYIPRKDSFKTLLAKGKAPTETPFKKMGEQIDLLAQSAIDILTRDQQLQETG